MEYNMEYKIKQVCNSLNIGVSKFYRLKSKLDCSVPEQNRMEYYYYSGRNCFITQKGYEWFNSHNFFNSPVNSSTPSNNTTLSNDIIIHQNQVIDLYKQRIEYLENENKRLLDIISIKEQKELAKDFKTIESSSNSSFLNRFFSKFKKN